MTRNNRITDLLQTSDNKIHMALQLCAGLIGDPKYSKIKRAGKGVTMGERP